MKICLSVSASFLLATMAVCGAVTGTNRYFELRLYSVTPGKLSAVVERFRDTVEPVRRVHGIQTLGYWTTLGTNSERFVYLLNAGSREDLQAREKAFGSDPRFQAGYAASNAKYGKTVDKIVILPLLAEAGMAYHFLARTPPRTFELRIYSIVPGKLEAFRRRWRDFAAPIYARHGLECVGCWTAETRDPEGRDQVVVFLAGDTADSIGQSVVAFHQDPEWLQVEKETERKGKLRAGVESIKLVPTDFSAVR